MRKILCLLLIVLVAFSTSGCGLALMTLFSEKRADASQRVEHTESHSDISLSDVSDTVSKYDDAESSDASVEETESSEPVSETPSEEPSEEPEYAFDPNLYSPQIISIGDLSVYTVDDDAFDDFPYDNYVYEDDAWYNYTLLFYASEEIKNFRLLELDDSVALCISAELSKLRVLEKGYYYIARVYVNDTTANLGYSYEIAGGDAEYYYFHVDLSGASASELSVSPFTPSQDNAYATTVDKLDDVDYYAYFDLDYDGSNELIVHTGTCEADYQFHFYDFVDGMAEYLSTVSGSHSSLVSDGEYCIIHGAQMGSEWATRVTLENGRLITELILDRTLGYDEEYTEYPYYVITYNY